MHEADPTERHGTPSFSRHHEWAVSSCCLVLLSLLCCGWVVNRERGLPSPKLAVVQDAAPFAFNAPDDLGAPASLGPAASDGVTRVTFRVTPGADLLIRSMDLSGDRHVLMIESRSNKEGESVPFVSVPGFRVWRSESSRLPTHSPNSLDPPAATDLHRFSAVGIRRCFQVPVQTSDGIREVPIAARICFQSADLRIAVDESLLHRNPRIDEPLTLERFADEVLKDALPLVEAAVGGVADLDGSGGLTLVLSQMNPVHRPADESRPLSVLSGPQTPLLGCVRGTDFLPRDHAAAKDIVYLDPEILEQPERRSILVHELSHAAVFCQLRRAAAVCDAEKSWGPEATAFPTWLHEGLAHWMESQVAGPNSVMRQRSVDYFGAPEHAAIILPNRGVSTSRRRGAARIAGLYFLTGLMSQASSARTAAVTPVSLNHTEGIRRLPETLFDQSPSTPHRIANAFGLSMADAVRYATRQAASDQKATLGGDRQTLADPRESRSLAIFGTAWCTRRVPVGVHSITICGTAASAIEVECLKP